MQKIFNGHYRTAQSTCLFHRKKWNYRCGALYEREIISVSFRWNPELASSVLYVDIAVQGMPHHAKTGIICTTVNWSTCIHMRLIGRVFDAASPHLLRKVRATVICQLHIWLQKHAHDDWMTCGCCHAFYVHHTLSGWDWSFDLV